MSDEETQLELSIIHQAARYRNTKIEKAIESYDKKIKDYKGKIEEGKKKEQEKVHKAIESEIKRVERSGDIKALDHLHRVKLHVDQHKNSPLPSLNKALSSYHGNVEKLEKKYNPYLDREHKKLEKLFKDEVARAIKTKNLSLARDLDHWKDMSMKNVELFPKYVRTKDPAPNIFRSDGRVKSRGQDCEYTLLGNELTIHIVNGPYQGWKDLFVTRDGGETFKLVTQDIDNNHNRYQKMTFEQSDISLSAMYAKLRYSKYKQSPGGDIWTFTEKVVKRKGDQLYYKFEDNKLLLMDKNRNMQAIWESRDGGQSFRLIKNRQTNYRFDNSEYIVHAIK